MHSFSVIIPARNAASTLAACLKSVVSTRPQPAEVIVVNDGSRDATRSIAESFGCKIVDVDIGKGPMQPRFAGVREAENELLVFVDADVCVREDSFQTILQAFEDPSVQALTGMLARSEATDNFFTAYKNEYMHYIFSRQPEDTLFLYGSLWAVRRNALVFFEPISEPFGSLVSDSEIGFRLSQEGKKLRLCHTLEVRHLKRYTFWTLLRNDFVIPFMFSRMYLRYGRLMRQRDKSRFSHASLGQVMAMGMMTLAVPAGIVSFVGNSASAAWVAAGLAGGFILFWLPFLRRVRQRGMLFMLKTFLFLPLDAWVMSAGMMGGFLYDLLFCDRAASNREHEIHPESGP